MSTDFEFRLLNHMNNFTLENFIFTERLYSVSLIKEKSIISKNEVPEWKRINLTENSITKFFVHNLWHDDDQELYDSIINPVFLKDVNLFIKLSFDKIFSYIVKIEQSYSGDKEFLVKECIKKINLFQNEDLDIKDRISMSIILMHQLHSYCHNNMLIKRHPLKEQRL